MHLLPQVSLHSSRPLPDLSQSFHAQVTHSLILRSNVHRGLFTEDNFEDHRLTAPRLPISANNPPSSSQLEEKNKGPTSVKVKKLTRGGSDEGDKLLDYVVSTARMGRNGGWRDTVLIHSMAQEMGAADAIEKGYLHQLSGFLLPLSPSRPPY